MTNLELTTGEKSVEKTTSSKKYELKFRSGSTVIVSEATKEKIEILFDRYFAEEKDAKIKLKGGVVERVSQLVEIKPKRDASGIRAEENMSRIQDMLEETTRGTKSEKIRWWCRRITENFKRVADGQPWVYYDMQGKECSKKESLLSIIEG